MMQKYHWSFATCALLIAVVFAGLFPVHAQQTLGSISGTVLDNIGAAI